MATSTIKNRCVICGKEKASLKCEGCSQTFCNRHFNDHRQELSKQLDEIEVTRDLLRQTFNEQTIDPQKHPLIQQINQWEQDSIKTIQETAKEARQLIIKHTTGHTTKIEIKLAKLTDQLRENRDENDFVETDLNQWREELKRLEEEFVQPSNISIKQDSIPLVTKIVVQTYDTYSGTYETPPSVGRQQQTDEAQSPSGIYGSVNNNNNDNITMNYRAPPLNENLLLLQQYQQYILQQSNSQQAATPLSYFIGHPSSGLSYSPGPQIMYAQPATSMAQQQQVPKQQYKQNNSSSNIGGNDNYYGRSSSSSNKEAKYMYAVPTQPQQTPPQSAGQQQQRANGNLYNNQQSQQRPFQ